MFLEFIKNEIIQAITNANEKVFQLSKRNPLYRGMGSTVVLAVVRNNLVCLANVGDSPAFLISELTGIEQKTEEHTHVNELVKEGKITKEDALSHPDRGILTRAIGPKSTVEAALVDFCVEADDFLLLCSDGLTQHVEHETIKEVITQLSPQEACAKLVNLSNQNGGTDNTTCVVVSWR
jgi:protein phosphatase